MILDILLIINAAIVIILALLQSGQSEGLSSAFTGSGGLNLFANTKERGAEKIIPTITLISGITFLVLAVLVRII
ncbi:MAG: preprotein translocase subunit SecG [Erysipelothrix sp.]|nr:preprotein translocase subunit SecG [Erysipelothrix sp.]